MWLDLVGAVWLAGAVVPSSGVQVARLFSEDGGLLLRCREAPAEVRAGGEATLLCRVVERTAASREVPAGPGAGSELVDPFATGVSGPSAARDPVGGTEIRDPFAAPPRERGSRDAQVVDPFAAPATRKR